jgi:isopenicillin N synthase-like dioxygenase
MGTDETSRQIPVLELRRLDAGDAERAAFLTELREAAHDVPPRSGGFVINIGEILELASDGYLRATMHRVVSPPPGVQRLSAAFFLGARLEGVQRSRGRFRGNVPI